MSRRKWDTRTKALSVLQGLKGTPVSQLCTEHQISQAQYYDWRDTFLANASKAFELHQQAHSVSSPVRGAEGYRIRSSALHPGLPSRHLLVLNCRPSSEPSEPGAIPKKLRKKVPKRYRTKKVPGTKGTGYSVNVSLSYPVRISSSGCAWLSAPLRQRPIDRSDLRAAKRQATYAVNIQHDVRVIRLAHRTLNDIAILKAH